MPEEAYPEDVEEIHVVYIQEISWLIVDFSDRKLVEAKERAEGIYFPPISPPASGDNYRIYDHVIQAVDAPKEYKLYRINHTSGIAPGA